MISGWLSKKEGELLAHFAKKADGIIVEIGSYQGKSTVAMAKATKNPIYAIDPHSLGSYKKFLQNTKKYKNIIPVKKTSATANKNWTLSITLLHIDGAHEYKFAKQDLELWLPHLKENGIVICHDAFCPFPDVFKAIKEEIFDKRGWAYIGVLDSQIFAIKGPHQLNWQRPFIILASNIWHNKSLPENLRFFIVNRVLKLFFLNKYMVFLSFLDVKRKKASNKYGVLKKLWLFVFVFSLTFFLVVLSSPVFADDPYIEINPEVPRENANSRETFYTSELDVVYTSGPIIFKPHPSYASGTQSVVDDAIDLAITHSSGKSYAWTHDFARNCTGIKRSDPEDITSFFRPGVNKIKVRLYDICGGTKEAIRHVLTNLTLVGSASGTLQPFLGLPWDYKAKGLSFTEASLAITSYFDHSYPLLSSGLVERSPFLNQVTTFQNESSTAKNYSSHDGYDYARFAKVLINDPVLAAGDGCATYEYSRGGGNTIKIDHKNGYQTRYLHLQPDGLFTKSTVSCIEVKKGQTVGKVGATGKVVPSGNAGAHIHFSLIKDKNGDGKFDDNIPDGMVDPFGWQSGQVDPWESYAFNYNGVGRSGEKSFYLWQDKIPGQSEQLKSYDYSTTFTKDRYKINFPFEATTKYLNLDFNPIPFQKISNPVRTIGTGIEINVRDLAGTVITSLSQTFNLTIDFSGFDLSSFKPETVAIYSGEDGKSWTKEQTAIDLQTKLATISANHFSFFTLAGEKKDVVAATTSAAIVYQSGRAQVTLSAVDSDYILYQLEDEDWLQYTSTVSAASAGKKTIKYYSVDNEDNIEEMQNIEFQVRTDGKVVLPATLVTK